LFLIVVLLFIGTNKFQVSYTGEKMHCAKGAVNIQTSLHFTCNNQSNWPQNVSKIHGGFKAPTPTNVTFDDQECKYDIYFDYDEACTQIPSGDAPSHSISNGSLILILFFPGVLLYFILGCLLNKMRGHEGIDLIPHQKFWVDLPDLIMDGFTFTMATICCQHEDRHLKDYESVVD